VASFVFLDSWGEAHGFFGGFLRVSPPWGYFSLGFFITAALISLAAFLQFLTLYLLDSLYFPI